MSASSDFIYSDDSNAFDPPSSPSTSHRFTSPPLVECQVALVGPMDSKRHALPLELVEYIIEIFHRQYRSFRTLQPLSEVNSQFRRMVLRRYMASLILQSPKQLASLVKMHVSMLSRSDPAWGRVGLHLVKSLTAQSGDLAGAPWRPALMSGLRVLHVSFAAEARSTQKIRAIQIFVTPFAISPMSHLASLTLTELWRIDVFLLGVVSGAFPGLVSLHLSCSENLDVSCCWTCFEDSSSVVVHSPIPNQFPTVASLTVCFSARYFLDHKTASQSAIAKALKPLTKLSDLHLGIFLSDEEVLVDHIEHYDSPKVYSPALHSQNCTEGSMRTILSQSESPSTTDIKHVSYTEDKEDSFDPRAAAGHRYDEVPPFPHGPELCSICSINVSGLDVHIRELEASLALAQKLKSLKTIGWSSFFPSRFSPEDERRIGDWQRAAKTYVLRSGGRVRVRRRPWD